MNGSFHLVRKTPDDGRTGVIRILNKQLADTLDLRSHTRQSYFNAHGPYTQELRCLFDGLSLDLRLFADVIAQHIHDAGGYAVATVRYVANESALRDYPADVLDAREQLDALLSSYSRYEKETQHNLKAAREAGDAKAADLMQIMLASIENDIWFLEAYLEGIAVGLHGRKLPAWTSRFPSPLTVNRDDFAAISRAAQD